MKGTTDCWGPVCAHHARGKKGMGQKRSDRETLALCAGHHQDIHALSGPFKGWGKQRLREWERERYEATQKALGNT